MTQIFGESGAVIPVTIIEAGPCTVTQVKTEPNDGYEAVQIGFETIKLKTRRARCLATWGTTLQQTPSASAASSRRSGEGPTGRAPEESDATEAEADRLRQPRRPPPPRRVARSGVAALVRHLAHLRCCAK